MKEREKQKFQDFDLDDLEIWIKSDQTCNGRKERVGHKQHQYS